MRGVSALLILGTAVSAWGQSLPSDAAPEAASDSLALDSLERGCGGGEMAACARLGVYLEMGRSTARNLPRAYQLYERACNGGDPLGCTQAGLMQENGGVVPADAGQARSRYEKACRGGGADGCYRLARLVETGRGGPRSEMRAAD